MTGYTDYLFLLTPPEVIKTEVMRYKKASAKYIGDFPGLQSPANIIVNQLDRQKPYMTETAMENLHARLSVMPPVLLHMDGFKNISQLHGKFAIYAYMRSTPAMESWFALLCKNLNIKKTVFPHIPVVRNIAEVDFKKLWPNFQHKKLAEPFWLRELKVLQRESFGTTHGKWEPYKTIEFKNATAMLEKNTWKAQQLAKAEIAAEKQVKFF
ncbi:hypothetical protein A0256_17800 [Mucilaginibacter sp. PAMC 26640]|nr:hypothetical protein A0256_17800 [Mucilaginibacter sp. PAMC 26640]